MSLNVRAKGKRAEKQVVDLGERYGVTCMLVPMSGALRGAEGDVKIGVSKSAQKKKLPIDEIPCLLRAEVKNSKAVCTESLWTVWNSTKAVNKSVLDALDQSTQTKCVIMKRQNTPLGSLTEGGDLSQAYLVMLGMDDFLDFCAQLMYYKGEVKRLKKKIVKEATGG